MLSGIVWGGMIVNRKRECSIFLFLSKEFLLNDASPCLSALRFCFALPKTKDGAESRVTAVTDTRGFPCFNWKPILVTFQVRLAVFSGVLWLIFVFVFFSKNSGFLVQAFWDSRWIAGTSVDRVTCGMVRARGLCCSHKHQVLRAWFRIALDLHLLSLCCMGGGRSFRWRGLVCMRAPKAPQEDYFLCIWEELREWKRIFLMLVDWLYLFILAL